MARIDIGKIIDLAGAIKGVLHEEAAKPSTSLEPSDVNKVTQQVTDAVEKKVNPILTNALNQEPWYQSRIFWGQVVAIGAPLVGLALPMVSDIPQDQLTAIFIAIGTLAGGIYTLIARFGKAKPPLGE